MDGLPTVSVIIPAYNEARDLPRCLATLRDQTHRPAEIIVVDDGSTDATADIARSFAGVTLLHGDHHGSGAARNTGAAAATGDVLAFLDADMRFARDFLAYLVAPIAAGAVGSFHALEYVANTGERWARLWNLNQRLPPTRKHPPGVPDRQAVFRAVRRDAFLAVNGFVAGGYDDDLSLAARLGTLAVVAPGAVCWHTNPQTLPEVYRQARWIGASRTVPHTPREFWRYCPLNPRGKGWRSLARPGERALPAFRIVYGTGVCAGILRAWRRGGAAK